MFEGGIVLQSKTDKIQGKGYIVGLDASLTSFGVYCLPVNHNEWYGFSVQSTAKDGSDMSRVIDISVEVVASLMDLPHPIVMAGIEDYGPINRTSGKIAQRAEICGIVKNYLLTIAAVPIIAIPPTSLKSFAVGHHHASKEDMLTRANNLGFWPDTHDEADAFFAARACECILNERKIDVSFTRTNPRG